jgi:hypothetical protein
MSDRISAGNSAVECPNLVPSKAKMHEFGEKANNLQKTVNEVRASFKPD